MTALTDLDQELRRIGGEYSGTWTYALIDIASGERIGFLQDDAFHDLRADIMGTLWEEFDITDIASTIRVPVEKWLRELGILTRTTRR